MFLRKCIISDFDTYNSAFVDCLIEEAPIFVLEKLVPGFHELDDGDKVSALYEKYVKEGCSSIDTTLDPGKLDSFGLVLYCDGIFPPFF